MSIAQLLAQLLGAIIPVAPELATQLEQLFTHATSVPGFDAVTAEARIAAAQGALAANATAADQALAARFPASVTVVAPATHDASAPAATTNMEKVLAELSAAGKALAASNSGELHRVGNALAAFADGVAS